MYVLHIEDPHNLIYIKRTLWMYCTLRISKKRQLILYHEYIHMTIMQKKKIFFLITNIALKQSILTLYIFYNGLPNLKKNPYKSMVLKCFLQILFSRCLTRMICLYRGQERDRKGVRGVRERGGGCLTFLYKQ